MKRYSAAQARQHLAAVLDAAEAGESVVIERAGVRFRVRAEPRRRGRRRPRLTAWLDPVVEAGDWSWVSAKRGLRFSPRKPRRR